MKDRSPSPIWSVVEGGESFESFCNNLIPKFEPNDSVPEAIRRRIETISKLLRYSYFEYDFVDVAIERSYQTLELALHLKYEMINPEKSKKNFKPYMDWAVQNGYLKLSNEQKKTLEYLRNHVTHLKADRTGGIVHLNMIKIICNDIINDLFTLK